MDTAILKELQSVRLFAGIEASDIPHMLGCIGGTMHSYQKSEYIFMEGEDLKKIGIIISGTVQMLKEDFWGQKMILELLTGGNLLGESFVCNDKSASTVSFLAASDCEIMFLPFHRLLTTCGMACKFHQRLIENMVVMIAMKNVKMISKMEILSKKTIRERILVWLSQQAQEHGSRKFISPLGRVGLAEYLCVDRSALTRELKKMKEDGLLSYDRNKFEIRYNEEDSPAIQ